MATITDPVIGNWYKDIETSQTFQVMAVDDDSDTIEVQFANGDAGEFDHEGWFNSTFDSIDDPEEWDEAYNDMGDDDLGFDEEDDMDEPGDEDIDLEDYRD
ncbi:MAG: hypothetical protein CTY34_10660 [Methylobacter sp.]|nr:MAG: hypothetical protein CTY34_10660 [Methylobacter sp.]PPD23413.1 MAG: hypothetical protein CTY24_04485 [Methylobacter sp.]PPD34342.1 MAG: hypothetical protein CTY18_08605 [Methylomonas sp.]